MKSHTKKKVYVAPSIEVVKIATTSSIAENDGLDLGSVQKDPGGLGTTIPVDAKQQNLFEDYADEIWE